MPLLSQENEIHRLREEVATLQERVRAGDRRRTAMLHIRSSDLEAASGEDRASSRPSTLEVTNYTLTLICRWT